MEFAGLHSFNKVVLGTGNSNAFEIDNISAGTIHLPIPDLRRADHRYPHVEDRDIGDTLTASVTGNATITIPERMV